MKNNYDFDYLIVGSGFGGSVSALRLSEKGYRVGVIEKGKRWKPSDFPVTNWNIRKFLWMPILKCFGIQKITLFRNVFILSGVGVGGGSLVYANTLVKPKPSFFKDPVWKDLADWESELAPHYETARRMLGATRATPNDVGDRILRKIGDRLDCSESFQSVDVAVYFGKPDQTVPDPYFGGAGPERQGCNFCGGCMVGCRFNAKNTLDKNYLFLAERAGAQVFPETVVERIEPLEGGGFQVTSRSSTKWWSSRRNWRAKKVIVAGGVLGSVKLLLENKYIHGTLPNLSSFLGTVVRTNGESLVGATCFDESFNLSQGIAISASIHPDPVTKIEVVRYSKGSDFMKLLAVPLVGPGNNLLRPLLSILTMVKSFPKYLKLWFHGNWAANTIILLVMQAVDNQIAFGIQRRWHRLFRKSFGAAGRGSQKIEAYIPVADRAARMAAQEIHGLPLMSFSEAFLNAPATAHILGGAKMGASAIEGVVDPQCRVHGYPDLYVIDGSIIPANLGVNPSLTITALAEYAMSKIPSKSLN